MSDETVDAGWVDEAVARELPGLGLAWVDAPAPDGARTPDGVRARLRVLADRWSGARAVTMRREPVPAAYRVFFRHVGLDPDVDRTPVEAVVVERLMHGGLRPRGRVEDALLVGGARDRRAAVGARRRPPRRAARASAPRRPASAWGRATSRPTSAPAGSSSPTTAARSRCSSATSRTVTGRAPRTRRLRVFAVHVAGVPQIHVEEALWACAEALAA